ncbi:rap guanine nucleotide exchange factor 1-like isoform X2 [Pecten maximus]|uniref:rap guanine nucleotide exchange factor 1-like isoform X2 n=1 Tax=Pecten maximus TaxID=6579 RepID=UPI0014588EE5|nr:rap guanine nucleotide exchange factor 1-like isoform X2 [Pecten maximus]
MSSSSKTGSPEKASGSKMLKKAKSFRDDVKGLIKRRPSSSAHDNSTSSFSQRIKPRPIRGNSLGDTARFDVPEKPEDSDKLQEEVNKVYRSLKYIRAVVDNEKLQVIPSTATVVLETVMDVFTLLNNFFLTKDSSTMLSRHNKVCQCLARFIQWADDILLNGKKVLNKEAAHEVITALSDGVEELKQISLDKLHDKKMNPSMRVADQIYGSLADSNKRSSLPEIPLTPREKEILEHTSEMGIYDNTPFTTSRSSDSISSNHLMMRKETSPPPKPPLPRDQAVIHRLVQQRSQESLPPGVEGDFSPPPLPNKENRRSLTNTLEILSGMPNPLGHVSPNQSPHTSVIYTNTPSELSSSPGHITLSNQSDLSISPLSRSPGSSVGSGLNRSSEDLLDSTSQNSSRTNSFSRTSSEARIGSSFSSSTMSKSSSQSDGTVDQINQLTKEINRLTSDIAIMTKKNGNQGESCEGQEPPTLPKKLNRLPSQYDNMNESGIQVTTGSAGSSRVVSYEARMSSSSTSSSQSFAGFQMQKSNTISFTQRTSSQETYSSSETFSSASHSSLESLPKPPPLPPKKRHIQAYMQTFGNYTQPSAITECVYSRHSINFYESQWQNHQMELQPQIYPRSNTISVISDLSSDSSFSGSAPNSPMIPPLPTKLRDNVNRDSQLSTTSSQSDFSAPEFAAEMSREKAASLIEGPTQGAASDVEPKRSSAPPGQIPAKDILALASVELPTITTTKPEIQRDADSDFAELNPLDDVDVSDQLIKKKENEDGPEIRGGSVDALVVHASAAGKSEFMYQEAFLTTYRTFILPRDLIDKVLYRFNKFQRAGDNKKKRLARNGFSLLVRIIDELSHAELEDQIIQKMMELVFELLCQGNLMLARILRKKIIEKCEAKKAHGEVTQTMNITSSISLASSPSDLLHLKSHDIAEQMTLMDAELFQKIEIPEVLLWAREQSEELSPNLTEFTEHFNKVSYWCRTQILIQEEAKEREKYLIKFIKIMRHLRKLSNFNSYLAILSAVDSAPIRRLEWQRQNLEALKEFCQLIDSSASFRAYRQALSETEPPCIPYIGLILQDLTFINIGNQDFLPDKNVNFAKRWQQFNILDSMRRFKKCNYECKRNEKIMTVFNNFEDYLSEESLWQISEKIKPRSVRKKPEPAEP